MKTAEERDLMVKRVKEAYAKWPNFSKLPVVSKSASQKVAIKGDPDDNAKYVAALYELCSTGAKVTGRYRGEDPIIVGE